MFKKTIKYKDYNGEERNEDFYFHLNHSEFMELTVDGSYRNMIQRMIGANDQKQLITEVRKLIDLAYGEKSDDGKKFIKNERLTYDFSQTAAYEALFMELATNEKSAAEFMQALVPQELLTTAAATETPLPPPPPVYPDQIQKGYEILEAAAKEG